MPPKPHRPQRPRTLALLATPAVVGAMTVAMPALAGTSLLGATAHQASSSHCIIAIVHRHRVRECLITGPRGPRGFTGAPGPRGLKGSTGAKGSKGSTGAKGATGATGAQGIQGVPGHDGANGTARAYAIVVPTSPTEVHLVSGPTFNITGVTEPVAGAFCLTPAAPIEPAKEAPVASPEVSYGSSGPGIVAVNAQHAHCPATALEVDTYTPGATQTLSANYPFTVIVP